MLSFTISIIYVLKLYFFFVLLRTGTIYYTILSVILCFLNIPHKLSYVILYIIFNLDNSVSSGVF